MMNISKYNIGVYKEMENHAGSKAVNDCNKLLKKLGYEYWVMRGNQGNSNIKNKIYNIKCYLNLFNINRDSTIVIQHPLYIGNTYLKVIRVLKHLKKCNIICIVHDLESIRGLFPLKKSEYELLDKTMMELSDVVIAHNSSMSSYIKKEMGIYDKKIIDLGVFDYLLDTPIDSTNKRGIEKAIVIAGNLSPEKSGYIYKLTNTNLNFNLYGINYIEQNSANLNYKGSYSPNELPNIIEGAFGLVWDGSTTTSCDGKIGEYLKFNNPHKVSLYIAAEIPIIVWKEAAIADFIIKNNLGIAVSTIEEIELVLEKVSKEQYNNMMKSIKEISLKLRKGDSLFDAIRKAENILLNENK